MKKLSILIQWLVVAGLAGFLAYVMMRPTTPTDYAPETWQDWNGVTVLSFAGIARSDSPAYPSVRRLEEQLTALRDAGYRTVRPEDVRAFLDERAPLPEKALLLIFEGGRKEAFIRATPVLQRTGFMAVLAVPTQVMSQWGSFYLKRGDIRKVLKLPQWQVGSMGHAAIQTFPGAADGETRHFLSHRLTRAGEPETAEAFRERILKDYSRSASLLEQAAGRPALLYLYPFGEAGQYPGSDPLAEAANRDAVTRHFGLAFIGGANAFNGPGSDPWTLTRLRVPGDWPAERLLAELASSQPRSRPQPEIGTAQEWVFERESGLSGSALDLPQGSVSWLRGSDAWTDVEASASLQTGAAGKGALYARYTGVRSWVRVALDGAELRVQERVGGRLHTLCRRPAPTGDQPRQVRLRLRNNRAWVWLNGEPAAENLPLAPATRRGRVGLGSDQGDVQVSAFSARPLPARWVLANSIRLVSEKDREQVQAVMPTWFRHGEKPDVAHTAQQDLMQAAVAGIHTVPLATGAAGLDAEEALSWAAEIDTAITRADLKLLTPSLAVEGPAFSLAAELRNRGYRVTHLLTPTEALDWGRSIAQLATDELLVINGLGAEAGQAVDALKRVMPTSRLAVREPEGAALPNVSTARLYDSTTDR